MPISADAITEVDAECSTWQQGDTFVGEGLTFVHIGDLAKPLTDNACTLADEGFESDETLVPIGSSIPGLIIISQTCDLVRSAAIRPFVQVAALQTVDEGVLREVRRGLRPRFAFVPGLEARLLVADLDAIMTVEKSVLTGIAKDAFIRGLSDDGQVRDFAECISRRFLRFAFPDDFATAVGPMQTFIKAKHNKQSDEGEMLRALREIRVVARPSWVAPAPSIEFLFIPNADAYLNTKLIAAVERLVEKFCPTGCFREPTFRIIPLVELSSAAYIASDRLDLDNLSRSSERETLASP